MFINHPNHAVQKNRKNWNCYLSNFKDYLISFDPACIAIAREGAAEGQKWSSFCSTQTKKKKKKKNLRYSVLQIYDSPAVASFTLLNIVKIQ